VDQEFFLIHFLLVGLDAAIVEIMLQGRRGSHVLSKPFDFSCIYRMECCRCLQVIPSQAMGMVCLFSWTSSVVWLASHWSRCQLRLKSFRNNDICNYEPREGSKNLEYTESVK